MPLPVDPRFVGFKWILQLVSSNDLHVDTLPFLRHDDQVRSTCFNPKDLFKSWPVSILRFLNRIFLKLVSLICLGQLHHMIFIISESEIRWQQFYKCATRPDLIENAASQETVGRRCSAQPQEGMLTPNDDHIVNGHQIQQVGMIKLKHVKKTAYINTCMMV